MARGPRAFTVATRRPLRERLAGLAAFQRPRTALPRHSLFGAGALRKAEPQEAKFVHAKGAPAAPSKMVFVWKPGAVPMTINHGLVVCWSFVPQVSDTATQNLGVTAMMLVLPWGFARSYLIGTVGVKLDTRCSCTFRARIWAEFS